MNMKIFNLLRVDTVIKKWRKYCDSWNYKITKLHKFHPNGMKTCQELTVENFEK